MWLLFSAIVLIPAPAFANNYTDRKWDFYSSYGKSGYLSGSERKEDASSVYIKCNTSTVSTATFSAIPHGAKNQQDTFKNMVYVKNGISYSAIKHTIKKGTEKKMPSFIYEAGGRFAKIYFNTTSGHVAFTGVWSPDSV